jgi:hypothetical protein
VAHPRDMTVKEWFGVALAVGSAWLGGSVGAAALEQANAAPLARASHSVASPESAAVNRMAR